MRLVVDACVLLDGALDPKSPAHQLQGVADSSNFVVCRWALDDAVGVIRQKSRTPEALEAARFLVEHFALTLSPLLVDDGGTHLPRSHDEMAIAAVESCGAEAVLTRNVKDFSTVATVTATEVLREHDPARWTVELPWDGFRAIGTVGLAGRCWPGESFGWFVESEAGHRVGLDPHTGEVRVHGAHRNVARSTNARHGDTFTLFARVRHEKVEISIVQPRDGLLRTVGTVTFRESMSWKPLLKWNGRHEWNLELEWTGAIDLRVADQALNLIHRHHTTEVAVQGVDVGHALREMVVLRHEVVDDVELLEVALAGAPQARFFRPRLRSG